MPTASYLFEHIAQALEEDAVAVVPGGLPATVSEALMGYLGRLQPADFAAAAVGRGETLTHDPAVRSNRIHWLEPAEPATKAWHDWTDSLRQYLNRRLFLGLLSFESHIARYAPGDAYIRHYDAFRGNSNRVVSLVAYLNPDWRAEDGGELLVYERTGALERLRVTPLLGTIVVFLSESILHEVLPARRTRYSVAGWLRVCADPRLRVPP